MSEREQAVPYAELAAAIGELLTARRRPRRSLVFGLVIAIVAGLISFGSYATADAAVQANPTGGGQTYYVLWGAAAFGVLKAGRAAFSLLEIRKVLNP